MVDAVLIDPLGRVVTLHDRTWFGHVIRGHSEMKNFRTAIEKTVAQPEQIRRSISSEDCRQYYSKPENAGLRIMVVIDVTLGLVKTAHFVKKVKGGALEWSQQTQSKES